MEENILLKLYRNVEIDKEKISQLTNIPSTYQWELARQNIKFILLFIDKVQLSISPLLNRHKNLIHSGNYEVFLMIWNEMLDEYPKYKILFDILIGLTEDTRFDFEKNIDDEIQRYFNFIKSYFSDLYDDIIESWNKCFLYGNVPLSKLGNGLLYFPDPSISSKTNKMINQIYKSMSDYINKKEKDTIFYGDIYFNDKIFNMRNFGLGGVALMGIWLGCSKILKKN